jgi:hypothetical protein
VYGNTAVGLVVAGEAAAEVARVALHGNGGGGVHLLGDSTPQLNECNVFANSCVGVLVSGRARPVCRLNRIQGSMVRPAATVSPGTHFNNGVPPQSHPRIHGAPQLLCRPAPISPA